jgi:hypothetical protein
MTMTGSARSSAGMISVIVGILLAVVLPRFLGLWRGTGISVGVWLVLWWILHAAMVRPLEDRMLDMTKDREEKQETDDPPNIPDT